MSLQNDPRSQADQKSMPEPAKPNAASPPSAPLPRSGFMQRRGDSPFGLGGFESSFRNSPFSLMRRMSEEMDRLFQGFGQFGQFGQRPGRPRGRTRRLRLVPRH